GRISIFRKHYRWHARRTRPARIDSKKRLVSQERILPTNPSSPATRLAVWNTVDTSAEQATYCPEYFLHAFESNTAHKMNSIWLVHKSFLQCQRSREFGSAHKSRCSLGKFLPRH